MTSDKTQMKKKQLLTTTWFSWCGSLVDSWGHN